MTTYLHSQQDASLSIGAALTTPRAPRSLPEICYTLRRKVTTFLEEKLDDEVLRDVQKQARLSLDIIHEALSRYGWVISQSNTFPRSLYGRFKGVRGSRVCAKGFWSCWEPSWRRIEFQ